MKIAVYGTLKRGHGNNRLLKEAKFVGEGLVEGARLYGAGIPFLVKDDTADYQVKVEVFEVDGVTLHRVDGLEGHPNWYRREPVNVHLLDGRDIDAEIYYFPHPQGEEIITGEYI